METGNSVTLLQVAFSQFVFSLASALAALASHNVHASNENRYLRAGVEECGPPTAISAIVQVRLGTKVLALPCSILDESAQPDGEGGYTSIGVRFFYSNELGVELPRGSSLPSAGERTALRGGVGSWTELTASFWAHRKSHRFDEVWRSANGHIIQRQVIIAGYTSSEIVVNSDGDTSGFPIFILCERYDKDPASLTAVLLKTGPIERSFCRVIGKREGEFSINLQAAEADVILVDPERFAARLVDFFRLIQLLPG